MRNSKRLLRIQRSILISTIFTGFMVAISSQAQAESQTVGAALTASAVTASCSIPSSTSNGTTPTSINIVPKTCPTTQFSINLCTPPTPPSTSSCTLTTLKTFDSTGVQAFISSSQKNAQSYLAYAVAVEGYVACLAKNCPSVYNILNGQETTSAVTGNTGLNTMVTDCMSSKQWKPLTPLT